MAFKTGSYLRRAEREDIDILVLWMEDPDFQRFLYGDPARSPRRVRENLIPKLGRSTGNILPGSLFLIIESKDRGPFGMVLLQNISWRNRSCSVDLYVGDKGLRSGVEAAAATFRTFDYCFDELNLHRITAMIYAFNSPSWRLMERTGAVRELTLKEHVLRDGQYHDMYAYGLLRREWHAFKEAMPGRRDSLSLSAMIESLNSPDAAPESAQ